MAEGISVGNKTHYKPIDKIYNSFDDNVNFTFYFTNEDYII